ncbi:hypothetical protein CsSME_00030501 [Camellia sinensis var. sinensis]
MARIVKSCLQLLLKLVNSTLGIVGISMILYSIWMVRVWQRDLDDPSSSSLHYNHFSLPWSIHAFLGIGIAMCAIACLGHIAADTANACCLSCYMVMIFVLLLVETAFMADMFLNSDWEKDLPEDPTGRFDDFIDFVKSNFDTCKWMALLTVLAQGCSILVATVLRTLDEKDKRRNYDNDDGDYSTVPGLPFLNHPMPVQPLPYTVADLPFPSKTETWKMNK